MTPMHSSSQQPEDSSRRPASQGDFRVTVPVSYETLMEMRREGFVGVHPAELWRWAQAARELEGRSTGWFGAAWALVSAATSFGVGALTVAPSHAVGLVVVAGLLLGGAGGCFKAHLDLNRRNEKDADRLAGEIEERIGSSGSLPGPSGDGLPPPQTGDST